MPKSNSNSQENQNLNSKELEQKEALAHIESLVKYVVLQWFENDEQEEKESEDFLALIKKQVENSGENNE
jgi:hypothetical protein